MDKNYNSILIILCVLLLSLSLFTFGVYAEKTYTGNGDNVIEIQNPGTKSHFLMKAIGNKQERHFAITGYDSENNRIKNFVNSTSSYEGLRLIPANTKILEINATGKWEINIKQLNQISVIETPGNVSGKGDYVFKIKGDPLKAEITGNEQENHFAVIVYDDNLNRLKTVVNAIEKYDGTVLLPKNSTYFEVFTIGDWSIKF
ncbi:MAG: hypothetical protein ACQERX_05195 [Bacillota bacterium]